MWRTERLTPDNTVFLLLSFEGPDKYSMAGGLGMRVTQLARTIAKKGFPTQLLFVGDPRMPGRDYVMGGRLLLHRWCQWISKILMSDVGAHEHRREEAVAVSAVSVGAGHSHHHPTLYGIGRPARSASVKKMLAPLEMESCGRPGELARPALINRSPPIPTIPIASARINTRYPPTWHLGHSRSRRIWSNCSLVISPLA